MTHRITPEGDARSGPVHGHSARAVVLDDDLVLDHHIEELLSALGELDLLRGDREPGNGG